MQNKELATLDFSTKKRERKRMCMELGEGRAKSAAGGSTGIPGLLSGCCQYSADRGSQEPGMHGSTFPSRHLRARQRRGKADTWASRTQSDLE